MASASTASASAVASTNDRVTVHLPSACVSSTSRMRKEVRDWTPAEWLKFVAAVKSLGSRLSQVPRYANCTVWEQFSATYAHYNHVKGTSRSLPWHSLFLYQFESELQVFDPTVTLPYWDWDLDAVAPWPSPVVSNRYFGTSTVRQCVLDGPFASILQSRIHPATSNNSTQCLRRGHGLATPGTTMKLPHPITSLVRRATRFSELAVGLEADLHAVGQWVGGDLGGDYAGNDPLLYAMRAFADRTWRESQARDHAPYDNMAYSATSRELAAASLTETLAPFVKRDGSLYTVGDVWSGLDLCVTYLAPTVAAAPPPSSIAARKMLSKRAPDMFAKSSTEQVGQQLREAVPVHDT
ncbi:Tyrosinase [Sorochytrium milnesiophthora]